MTGLELDEIQVGQAVFFILGFAAGFPLSAREVYVRSKVLWFGKALSFWISTFNICCFTAGLEKAGVQKWGGEVSDGPSCRGGISLLPRASSLFIPVPLSWSPPSAPKLASSHLTAGLPSLLPCRLGKSPSSSLRSPGSLSIRLTSSASFRGGVGGGSAPGNRHRVLLSWPPPPASSVPGIPPLSRCPRVSVPSAPPASRWGQP